VREIRKIAAHMCALSASSSFGALSFAKIGSPTKPVDLGLQSATG
jgi:hypothetical protein